MCWLLCDQYAAPLPWMEKTFDLELPRCDEDTRVYDGGNGLEASCAAPPFHPWPIPGKTAVSKRRSNHRKKHQQLKLENMPVLFSNFTELPTEIKLKILNLAEPAVLKTPRVISFIAEKSGHVRAFAKVPTLLHASRESREEALKEYQLCFAEICGGRPVYINFQIDRLYMYTAETFRRFFLHKPAPMVAWHAESNMLFSEARYMFLNCSFPSLPVFLPDFGFKKLKYLVLPTPKFGNLQEGLSHRELRWWTTERREAVKRSFLPQNDNIATEFKFLLTYGYRTSLGLFKDMVRSLFLHDLCLLT